MALWITLQFHGLHWAEVLLEDFVRDLLITTVRDQFL